MEMISRKGIINLLFLGFILAVILKGTSVSGYENKYSEAANLDVKNLRDPLRMAKLNIIWEKARKRLAEPKLKKLLSELKVQDKEELTFKKLKSSGGDKGGLKEAELRKNLQKITRMYGLESQTGSSDSDSDDMDKKIEKAVFKDKKLHKLWIKAEQSGLTQEELKTLREEFQHHEDKIQEYYSLIDKASASPNDIPNVMNDVHEFEALETMEGSLKEYHENINMIREKHREIKNSYVELHKKATSGPDSKEFSDPKVVGLWKLALRSNFDNVELESLYTELKHYETRLHKLSYLSLELNKISLGKLSDDLSDEDKEKILSASDTEGRRILEERLQKQRRKTEKLHEDLELRILARHSEL